MGLGPFTAAQTALLVSLATTSYSNRRELIDAAVVGIAGRVGGVVNVSEFTGSTDSDEGAINAAVAALGGQGTLLISDAYDLSDAAAAINIPAGVGVLGVGSNAVINGDGATTAFQLSGGGVALNNVEFSGVGLAIDLDPLPDGDNGAITINGCTFDGCGAAVGWDNPVAGALVGQLAISNNQAINGTGTQLDLQGLTDSLSIKGNVFEDIVGGAISVGDDTMAGAIQRRGLQICNNRISNLTSVPPAGLSAIVFDGVGFDVSNTIIENVVGVTGPTRAIECRGTYGTVAKNTIVGSGGGGWIGIDLDGVNRDRSVTVAGTVDGDYVVTLTAVDADGSLAVETHTHPAAGQDATQIRDALEALVDAGTLASGVGIDADGLSLVPANGRPVAVAVAAPNDNLTLSSARPTGYGVVVSGNVIQCQGTGVGIQIANQEVTVVDNKIYEPSGNGIEVTTAALGGIEIADNRLYKTGTSDTAISIQAGADYTITDNQIQGFDAGVLINPISLNTSIDRVKIEGNAVTDNSGIGIDITANADGVSVNDLEIRNNAFNNGDTGIRIVGTTSRVTLGRNPSQGQATADLTITSPPASLTREAPVGSATQVVDVVAAAGWGDTAVVTIEPGSNDVRGQINVTPGGAGIAADPALTMTFRDGAYAAQPFGFVRHNNGDSAGIELGVTMSPTQMAIRFGGLPVGGTAYSFTYRVEQ